MHTTSVSGTYTEDTLLRTTLETGYKHTARPGTPTVYLFYILRILQSLVWSGIVYGGGVHMNHKSVGRTQKILLGTTLETGY